MRDELLKGCGEFAETYHFEDVCKEIISRMLKKVGFFVKQIIMLASKLCKILTNLIIWRLFAIVKGPQNGAPQDIEAGRALVSETAQWCEARSICRLYCNMGVSEN